VALAASLFLFLAVQLLATLGLPLMLFTAAPLAVLCVRQGESVFLTTAAIGLVGTGLVLGPSGAAAFLVAGAVPALLIGRGLAFQWAPERIVGPVVVIAAVATLATLSQGDGLRAWVAQVVDQIVAGYKAAGLPPEVVDTLTQQAASLTTTLYHISPMLFTWGGMLLGTAALLATRYFFTRYPHPAVTLTPLTRWHLPDVWVWGLIGAAVLAMVPEVSIRVCGKNLLGVLALAYAFQGWAVMVHVFRARRVHPAIQGFCYLTLLLWPLSVIGLAILLLAGVFDMWTDVRKLRTPADPPSPTP